MTAGSLVREEEYNKHHGQACQKSQRHADGGDPADRFNLPFAPVLGTEDYDAVAGAHDDHLQQKLDLVYHSHTGQGVLTVAADHHVVCQIDRVSDEILQRDDHCHGE